MTFQYGKVGPRHPRSHLDKFKLHFWYPGTKTYAFLASKIKSLLNRTGNKTLCRLGINLDWYQKFIRNKHDKCGHSAKSWGRRMDFSSQLIICQATRPLWFVYENKRTDWVSPDWGSHRLRQIYPQTWIGRNFNDNWPVSHRRFRFCPSN